MLWLINNIVNNNNKQLYKIENKFSKIGETMSKKRNRSKHYNSFVSKIGIGFDTVLDLIEKVDSSTNYDDLTALPPFNIKKTGEKSYAIELSLPGAKKEAIKAELDQDYLSISAKVEDAYDPEGDDLYFHKGIFSGGKFEAKFAVAKNLQFASAEYVDSILKINLADTNLDRKAEILPIGPFPTISKPVRVEYNSLGQPVVVPMDENVNTSANVVALEEIKETSEEVVESTPVVEETTVVVNANDKEVPTVEVVMPTEVPQIVEVKLEDVSAAIETNSAAPQATIVLEDATHEIVSDNVALEIVKTEEGKADIVVAIPEEVLEKAEEKGIDIIEDVTNAINAGVDSAVIELPKVEETNIPEIQPEVIVDEKVEVIVPAELPAVVELVKSEVDTGTETPTVELKTEVSGEIPTDAVLIPIVTQEGQNDIVVAVKEELHTELVDSGVSVIDVIENAIKEVEPEVVTTEVVTEEVVLNADNNETPTVSVDVPVEMPQVVEVVATVNETVDPASSDPQITVELKDATTEIVSDNVVTEIIKTEEGKADIVVAVDAEVHSDLLEQNIDIIETVKEAVAEVDIVAPGLPEAVIENAITVDVPLENTETPVTVNVPEVIPTVVEAVVVETPKGEPDKVEFVEVAENIPVDATLTPIVTQEGQPDIVVVTTPETNAQLETLDVKVEDLAPAIQEAAPLVINSDETVAELPPQLETASEETAVVVNSETKEAPTVEVVMPTEVPQIVEVTISDVVEKVDNVSTEPQATVELKDATFEVSDNVTLEVVKTEEGKADIVVAIPEETAAKAEELGLDIKAAVEEAIKTEEAVLPEPVAEPIAPESVQVEVTTDAKVDESVTISVPEEVTPVMSADVVVQDDLGKVIELKPADGNIPVETTVVPVVTMEGQPDIVVAVSEEAAKIIEATGEELVPTLEKAVQEAKSEVVTEEHPDVLIEQPNI